MRRTVVSAALIAAAFSGMAVTAGTASAESPTAGTSTTTDERQQRDDALLGGLLGGGGSGDGLVGGLLDSVGGLLNGLL